MNNLISGSRAFILGALHSGATYYAGYPITPASQIMLEWVRAMENTEKLKPLKRIKPLDIDAKGQQTKLTFLQSEDEIAAIHSVIGASLAGALSFTATSGPGYSLMQEGINLAYTYKIPLVLIDVQRQGPSTGMPTLAAQGDLMQSQFGSHSDIIMPVFTPSSVEECYEITIKAFNLAKTVPCTVTILTDGFIANLTESVDIDELYDKNKDNIRPNNFKPLAKNGGKYRHFTGFANIDGEVDTQSLGAIKSWSKHMASGIAEALEDYEDMYTLTEARTTALHKKSKNRKYKETKSLLITFGTTYRVAEHFNDKFDIINLNRLFPILKGLEQISKKYKNLVVLEMNNRQYADFLQSRLLRKVESIRVYSQDFNIKAIQEELKKYE